MKTHRFYQIAMASALATSTIVITPQANAAFLHITGKNGQATYLYIDILKIAGKWASFFEFMNDDEL